MRLTSAATIVVLAIVCANSSQSRADPPDKPALGSPDFVPTPDRPMGWRGDGNGRFPAADPPLTWGRFSRAVKDLGTQAKKPKPDDKGKAMPEGVIRDWLTLGPVPIPDGKAAKDEFGADEAALAPDEGDASGNLAWKTVTLDTSWLDFRPMYQKAAPDAQGKVAYAHAWIYSAEGRPVFLNVMLSGAARIWLNGKGLGAFGANGSRLKLALVKGWNGLLVRVAPLTDTAWSKGVVQWHFNAAFFGAEGDEYESRNILWSTPMPDNGPGVGSPILMGDKLLVQAEAATLVCLSAQDGRVLWARSSTYADAATPEERRKNPEVFAEVDPLAAKVEESLRAYAAAPDKFFANAKARDERIECERRINKLLRKMDPEKYVGQTGSEAGEAAPTPVCDGRSVYAVYAPGVVACFDLAGRRQWTAAVGVKHEEHGYCASPCLIDGKVVIKASSYRGAVALDARTGAPVTPMPLWKADGLHMYSTPLPLSAGGEKLIVQSFGVITRAGDGKVLAQRFAPPYYNVADYVSPTAEGAVICSNVLAKADGAMRFVFQTLPEAIADPLVMKDTKECEYDVKAFPCWFSYNHNASPLLYQGLAYVVSVDGVLTVLDAAKGEVVYQKLLDLGPIMYHNGPIVRAGCSGSPTLAGNYIYIWDDQGASLVLAPGRTFKQVARNRIEQLWFRYGPERNECTIANPIFCGNKLFQRGEVNLYCIGQKGP